MPKAICNNCLFFLSLNVYNALLVKQKYMINSYLRDLVQSNHRVIIPDFGAFLKKDKAATSLENSVTFSPFLRFNDGLLEDYLIEKEHITREVASARVRQYVQDIKQTIAEQRPFYVDDLGAFYEDERSSVQFLFAETEKEAQRKFDELMSKSSAANVSTAMPELEVEASATPLAVVAQLEVEPAPEVKKRTTKKKEAEASSEEESEEVQTIMVKGKKKADMKEAKKRETKDANAVSKTIINVNVNTETDKEELARTDEKAKQLEAANSSLQRWMEEVEKRKEQQSQEEKKALESQVQPTPEELEAQRRRQEEVERALTEKRRRDEEEAKRKAEEEEARAAAEREREAALSAKGEAAQSGVREPLAAVWEEEVVGRRKRGSRGALLLLLVLLLVLVVAGVMWFWTPISEALGWESEYELTDEALTDNSYYYSASTPAPAPAPKPVVEEAAYSFIPAVSVQQQGAYYVVVGTFHMQNYAMTFCQTLHKLGLTPEIVKVGGDKFSVCVGKYGSMDEAKVALTRYTQKYGKAWILY